MISLPHLLFRLPPSGLVAATAVIALWGGIPSTVSQQIMAPRSAVKTERPRRAGFTLIELLGVITIIALLLAIAFPAYQSVMSNARIAQGRAEITALESAIADFQAQFGIVPPSHINLSNLNDANTKAILRQMFPQIEFNATLKTSLSAAGLNQDLRGTQALVFFLGGMPVAGETPPRLTGFSKNPANPFAAQSGSGSRIGPYFEFKPDRLIHPDDDSDNPLTYVGALQGQTLPYIYVSTSGTGAYVAADAVTHTGGVSVTPYRSTSAPESVFNPHTYQLISPGFDGAFGNGGDKGNWGDADLDNLTNFHQGPLGK